MSDDQIQVDVVIELSGLDYHVCYNRRDQSRHEASGARGQCEGSGKCRGTSMGNELCLGWDTRVRRLWQGPWAFTTHKWIKCQYLDRRRCEKKWTWGLKPNGEEP